MSGAFDFYIAPGLRVWAAAHAIEAGGAAGGAAAGAAAGAEAGAGWLPGTVVGVPAEALGRWPVSISAEGAGRVEMVPWTALLPRRSGASAPALSLPLASAPPTESGPRSGPPAAASAPDAKTAQTTLSATRAEYRRAQFEQKAARHWDLFYRSNTVNFFKDRHWLDREFPEIGPCYSYSSWQAPTSTPTSDPNPPRISSAARLRCAVVLRMPRFVDRCLASYSAALYRVPLMYYAEQVVGANAESGQTSLAVECGCGVGNALFPLLAAHPTLHGVGVDFSVCPALLTALLCSLFCPAH
jgi:hypothetical protein